MLLTKDNVQFEPLCSRGHCVSTFFSPATVLLSWLISWPLLFFFRVAPLHDVTVWSLVIGIVFLLSALGKGPVRGWPVSLPVLYLLIGIGIGPWGLGLLVMDMVADAKTVEVLTEIGVLVSLLTAGLKLTPSWSHFRQSPIPLATIGMGLTIAGIAAVGHFSIGLPIGVAVLLGAVLAPTDPVLASEVQIKHADDKDKLRYSLTGEAGLNDGAAFPFIMLGLGLIGLHDLGDYAWRWFAVDLVWAVGAGIGCGLVTGYLVSRVTVWLKRNSRHPVASEELLVLATIGLAYGVSLAIGSYGFLAVFAAGVAMRMFADGSTDENEQADKMMGTVAKVNERFGEIIEVALVVVIGVLLSTTWTLTQDWWFALVLFAIVRPISTYASMWRTDATPIQKRLVAFFGIRGIGSVYYLTYAIGQGLDVATAERLSGIVLTTVAMSLLIHSNVASPLLCRYEK